MMCELISHSVHVANLNINIHWNLFVSSVAPSRLENHLSDVVHVMEVPHFYWPFRRLACKLRNTSQPELVVVVCS
jgi:hypothetical protein